MRTTVKNLKNCKEKIGVTEYPLNSNSRKVIRTR